MLQKFLDRFKVSTKLYFLVFILCSTIIVVAAYGLFKMSRMDDNIQDLYANRVVCMEQLVNVRHAYAKNIVFTLEELKDGTISYHEAEKRMDDAYKEINTNWPAYKLTYLTPDERKLVAQAEIIMHKADSSIADERALLDKLDTSKFGDLHPVKLFNVAYALVEKLNELLKLQVSVSKDIIQNSNRQYKATIRNFYLLICFVLLFSVLLFLAILFDTSRLVENLQATNIKLSENEEKLTTLFENAGDAIMILDESLNITLVNNHGCQLLGYSHRELLGMRSMDIMAPEEQGRHADKVEELKNIDASTHERKLLRKDGTLVETEINVQALKGTGYIAIIRDITERKKAQDEIKKSESEFRAFFDNLESASCLLDTDKRYVLFNKQFVKDHVRLTGVEPKVGQVVYDLFPSEVQAERHKLIDKVIDSSNHEKIEIDVDYSRDGRRFFYRTAFNPVISDGKIIGVATISIDMSSIKEAELDLKKSEEKNRAVIENISDAIFLMDEKTVSYYHSPSVQKIFGYTFEETHGAKVFEYIHPDEVEEASKFFGAIAANPGATFHNEFRVRHKNGSYIWVEGTATNLLNNDSVKAIILNCRDITERKMAEIEILQLNRLYQFISEINESVLKLESREEIFSEACRIAVDVGKFRMAWVGVYNESNDQIVPVAWAGHEEGFMEAVKVSEMKVSTSSIPSSRAIRMKTHFYYDDIANDPDIPPYIKEEMLKRNYLSGISLPIFVDSKIVAAIVFLMSEPFFFNDTEVKLLREVTDNITYALDKLRIRDLQAIAEREVTSLNESLENKVIERTAQLKESNKELESFSYSVSHDLRTPLAIIHGYAQVLLQENSKFDEDTQDMLKAVMGNAEKMADLIDDILALSTAVKTEAKITKLDMTGIAKAAYAELEKSLKGGIKATITLNPLLPCDGDKNLISQVFTNLISNAIKYSGRKEKPEIEVGSYQKNDECIYYVKDNGAGFDMKNYNKLFGVFQRLHSSKEFEGTGVGLALVKRIIVKHSGKVWAEAEPDKGATFYFSLPASG